MRIFLIQRLINGLELLGHKTKMYTARGSIVCGITQNQTGIFGNADCRKGGDVVGFKSKMNLKLDRKSSQYISK